MFTHTHIQEGLSLGDVVEIHGLVSVVNFTESYPEQTLVNEEFVDTGNTIHSNTLVYKGFVDVKTSEVLSADTCPRPVVLTASGLRLKTESDASYHAILFPLEADAQVGDLVKIYLG